MKRDYYFSDKPFIHARIRTRYVLFEIDTYATPWKLSEACIHNLNRLVEDYIRERGISAGFYLIGKSSSYTWRFSRVLKEDLFYFWDKVKEILNQQDSFVSMDDFIERGACDKTYPLSAILERQS